MPKRSSWPAVRVFLETGRALDSVDFLQGRLRIGEAMAPPLIKAVTGDGTVVVKLGGH